MNFIKSFFSQEKEPGDEEEDIPPPKGAYDIDYSKFDDPNFNPFETKTKVVNKFDENPVKGNILLENVMKGVQ